MKILNNSELLSLTVATLLLFISISPLESYAAKSKKFRFNDMTIDTPYPLTQNVIAANLLKSSGKELLTISVDQDKNRWLMIYAYNQEKEQYEVSEQAIIPKKFHSFDIGEAKKIIDAKQLQNIYFVSSNALYIYQAGKFRQLSKSNSIYLMAEAEYLQQGDFIHDLNNDIFDDVIVTDFNETHFLIGSEVGTFVQQSLPIKPRMRMNGTKAIYTPVKLYFSDVNFDNKVDVAQVDEGEIFTYKQLNNGQFSTVPENIKINDEISGYDWRTKRDESGEQFDQSNLEYRMLEELRDLNADGITDIVVRYTKASGVLDRVNDYEIYLGAKQSGKLVFPTEATSVIRADGTLTGLEFVDIDNDEVFEVLLAGFDIGLSQIIGALVAGSIDQDVYVFKMDNAGSYNSKPNISKEVELNFSLSSGQSGSAVVKLADVTGDGLKELILSDDDDELRIYLGQQGKKSFAKRGISYKTLLPSDGNLVSVNDLNEDGKDDFLMKFSLLDGDASKKKFKVLLAL